MNQPTLFDPARTSPTPCPVPGCEAIRFPNQHRTPTCHIDRERALGGDWVRRPAQCLNHPTPESDPIPY